MSEALKAAARQAMRHSGKIAAFRPQGAGDGTDVYVRRRSGIQPVSFGETTVKVSTHILHVLVEDVPQLEAGDTFQFASDTLKVEGEPSLGEEGIYWTAEASKV